MMVSLNLTDTITSFRMYRMTSQTRLCVFIFIAYGMIALTDAEDQIKCMNLHYSGPIKEVIEMKPTKLAEATSEAADIAKGFAIIDMVSNAIDGIPFVGSQLSSLFGHLWMLLVKMSGAQKPFTAPCHKRSIESESTWTKKSRN